MSWSVSENLVRIASLILLSFVVEDCNFTLFLVSLMDSTEQSKFSILMFPWLAYSHVFPFLELSKRLSTRYFRIYFCSSAVNLDLIRNDLSDSIIPVELQLPSLPELPPKFHTTKNLPSNLLPNLLQVFQTSSTTFSEILNTVKPDLLIYDFFQPWASNLALSNGIPSVYFATSGATPFSYFHHVITHKSFSTYPYPEIYLLDHEIRNLLALVEPEMNDVEKDFGNGVFKLSNDIVLVKSSRSIEGKYIDYLSELCNKRVLPICPLVKEPFGNDESGLDIIEWLSNKEPLSTVFICFGSEHVLSREQIMQLAKGLDLCDANFIWVIRFSIEEKPCRIEDALPEGFLDRVKGRGMFVEGWAPQAKVLSHPGIGGFVSHCGWSSVLESLYFGVPIIALPIKFDQPINARLVVDTGVGVEIKKDENGYLSGEEVAKAINNVVVESTSEGLRIRARNLSEKMKLEESEILNDVSKQLLMLCKKKLHASNSSSES